MEKQSGRKLLFPVDFKESSLKAAGYARELAKQMNAGLIFLNVIDTPGILAQFFSSGDLLEKISGEARGKLLDLAESVKKDVPMLSTEIRVERGKPYQKILEVSKEPDVCMIILGENHQCGDPEDELGTTVYHVTLKSFVPVLTLKGDTSKMKDRIVVPLDLTKKTNQQLSAAIYFGLDYKAKIYLVSALVGGIAKKESRIYKKLKEAKETLEMNGVECEMKLFDRTSVPPFKRVLEYAEKIDAGMILLMTHQEGYSYDNYIGAFAHHIMNLSKIPVLSITSLPKIKDFTPFFKTLVDPLGILINKK